MAETPNPQPVRFVLEPYNRGFDTADLLDDMRRVAASLNGKPLTWDQYERLGRFTPEAASRRLKSWNAALIAAGLAVVRRQGIPLEEYFENLASMWTALGRQPRRADLLPGSTRISKGAYERRFGGWRNALKAFVQYMNDPTSETVSEGRPSNQQRGTPRNPSLRLRWRVLVRDSFKCVACGRSPALQTGVRLAVDHVHPWAKGGQTAIENLQTLCEECNDGKGDLVL